MLTSTKVQILTPPAPGQAAVASKIARTASLGEQGAGGDTNARKTARTASQKREGESAEGGGVTAGGVTAGGVTAGGVTAGGDTQKSKYVKMLIMLYMCPHTSMYVSSY